MRAALAAVRIRWRSFLLIALLVAALAGLGSARIAPNYAATTTLVVTSAGGAPDTTAALVAARSSAATSPVLADIAKRAGAGTTTDQVATGVAIAQAGSSSLAVTATGVSLAAAAALAAAARDALVAASASSGQAASTATLDPLRARLADIDRQLAARPAPDDPTVLQAERDALVRSIAEVSSAPWPGLQPGPAPVPALAAPARVPLQDAGFAFLITLLALAVAVPLWRAGRGRLSEGGASAQLQRDLDLPVFEVGRSRRGIAMDLAELYRTRLRDLPWVTVVQLSRPAACDLGAELVRSASLIGDRRVHDDRTPGSCREPVDDSAAPVIRTLRTRTLDRDGVRPLVDAGPTVLVAETSTARRAELIRVRSLLRGVGAEVVAVVVWRGRLPRDPSQPWAPPPKDASAIPAAAPAEDVVHAAVAAPRKALESEKARRELPREARPTSGTSAAAAPAAPAGAPSSPRRGSPTGPAHANGTPSGGRRDVSSPAPRREIPAPASGSPQNGVSQNGTAPKVTTPGTAQNGSRQNGSGRHDAPSGPTRREVTSSRALDGSVAFGVGAPRRPATPVRDDGSSRYGRDDRPSPADPTPTVSLQRTKPPVTRSTEASADVSATVSLRRGDRMPRRDDPAAARRGTPRQDAPSGVPTRRIGPPPAQQPDPAHSGAADRPRPTPRPRPATPPA